MGTRYSRFVILIIHDMRQKTVKEQACAGLIIIECANAIHGTHLSLTHHPEYLFSPESTQITSPGYSSCRVSRSSSEVSQPNNTP